MINIEIFDILLMILHDVPEGIRGKTAIQKIAYFTSIKLKFNMNYFAHFYGPYSRDVANTLQALSDFNFIEEKKFRTRNNRYMHIFSLNDDGKKVIDGIINNNLDAYKNIQEVVTAIEPYDQNINILSWAAKIYYILNETGKSITEKEIIKLARQHDWKLTENEIQSAKRLLLELKFVKVTNN